MIREVSEKEILYKRKVGQADIDIHKFMESDAKCCEVVEDAVSPATLYYRYFQAIKRNNYPIKVMRRSNRVFMIKEDN